VQRLWLFSWAYTLKCRLYQASARIISEKPTDKPVAKNRLEAVALASVKLPTKNEVSAIGPTMWSVYQILAEGERYE